MWDLLVGCILIIWDYKQQVEIFVFSNGYYSESREEIGYWCNMCQSCH
jgi:elongation factor P hydroxylase